MLPMPGTARSSAAFVLAIGAAWIAASPAQAASARTLSHRVVDRGTVVAQALGEPAQGRVVRSRRAASRLLRHGGLERARAAADAVDYARRSLVVVRGAEVPKQRLRPARAPREHRCREA